MKLTEALKTLHNRGFMVETRTSTRFARQTFKPEPEEVELPIIKASNSRVIHHLLPFYIAKDSNNGIQSI